MQWEGEEEFCCLMAKVRKKKKKKISLFEFSPGFGVKSKVVQIESRNLPPFIYFFSPSVSLYSPPDLFFFFFLPVLLIWSLEAGDAGAINHTVTGVDMSLSPNGDDSARSFSSAFPLQRWASDTVHLTCHFPALHSAICAEPIKDKENF